MMRNKVGTLFMILGTALILGALSLLLYNQKEEREAAQAVMEVLPAVIEAIEERQAEPTEVSPTLPSPTVDLPGVETEPADQEMAEIQIDGYRYIGYISMPTIELELPVMSNWSYPQLKIAPCRYSGSAKTNDLVLMAHNYKRHFGLIRNLNPGDLLSFQDAEGVTVWYEVMAVDVLAPTAIEEMTAGAYDLTLFTCTYGGESRVTVRCDRVKD